MRLKAITAALVAAAAIGLVAVPATAAPKKKDSRIYYDERGRTVYVNRDEDGRARTKIIVQKRSYLDPGTEVFPGENSDHKYAFTPNHTASGILDNTVFGGNQTALPTMWTLPFRSNPWIGY
jgi:hypothetical protein